MKKEEYPLFTLLVTSRTEFESDTDIIENLYRAYFLTMKKKACYMTGDACTAEDLVHESFLRLFDKDQTLRMLKPDQLYFYVMRTIHNVTLNHVEKQKKKRQFTHNFSNDDDVDNIPDISANPEQWYERKEQSQWIEQSFESLSKRDQQLLRNKYILCLTDKENAHLIGLSEVNVRSYLTRARRRVKSRLTNNLHIERL